MTDQVGAVPTKAAGGDLPEEQLGEAMRTGVSGADGTRTLLAMPSLIETDVDSRPGLLLREGGRGWVTGPSNTSLRPGGEGLVAVDRFQEVLDVANLLARLSGDMRDAGVLVGESGKTMTELVDEHRARREV